MSDFLQRGAIPLSTFLKTFKLLNFFSFYDTLPLMQNLVNDWLQKHFDQNFCSNIEYAPVPRGQQGDLAMKFFKFSQSSEGLENAIETINACDNEELKKPFKAEAHNYNIQELVKHFERRLKNCPFIQKTEMAGPYLNLFFAPQTFFEQVLKSPLSGRYAQGQNIVIEFSGPNTNKPLHLGHMRNHALGISVANLLESVGATVHRVNIINDRGIHICKSMLAYQKWGGNQEPNKKSDHFVGDWYVRFSEEEKKNPALIEEANDMLLKWENGDTEVRDLWKRMSDWARQGHAKVSVSKKTISNLNIILMDEQLLKMGWKRAYFKNETTEPL